MAALAHLKALAPKAISCIVAHDIIPAGQLREYGDGDCIHRSGDEGARLSLIVKGKVRLSNTDRKGRRIETALLLQGELFGVHQALSIVPYTHDAHADGPTTIVSFDHATFRSLLGSHAGFRDDVFTYLADRLVKSITLIENERRFPLTVRVGLYLKNSCDRTTLLVQGTQQQHSEALGVSRYALGSSLQDLSEQGLIEVGRQSIAIVSLDKLRAWIKDRT